MQFARRLRLEYNVFDYIKKHKDMGKLAYDSKTPEVHESDFNNNAYWKDFYGDAEEELPTKMPESHGNVTKAPIIWFSKRQIMAEAEMFGSEFVALRVCKELIVALRYKLRMFGVTLDGPADVFCDNRGVVMNTSKPESTLQKKHNAINYHAVREAAASGIL